MGFFCWFSVHVLQDFPQHRCTGKDSGGLARADRLLRGERTCRLEDSCLQTLSFKLTPLTTRPPRLPHKIAGGVQHAIDVWMCWCKPTSSGLEEKDSCGKAEPVLTVPASDGSRDPSTQAPIHIQAIMKVFDFYGALAALSLFIHLRKVSSAENPGEPAGEDKLREEKKCTSLDPFPHRLPSSFYKESPSLSSSAPSTAWTYYPAPPQGEKHAPERKHAIEKELGHRTRRSLSVLPAQITSRRLKEGTTSEHYETAVKSLLGALQDEWGDCFLTAVLDPAHDFILPILVQPQGSFFRSVAYFVLPAAANKNSSDYSLQPLREFFGRRGESVCTAYVLLVHDAPRLVAILEEVFDPLLNLASKLFIVTTLSRGEVLPFLQSFPINKFVHLLLVTSYRLHQSDGLLLETHDFFTNQQRISLRYLGFWSERGNSFALTSAPTGENKHGLGSRVVFFPEKLRDFHQFKLRAVTFHYPPVAIFDPQPDGSVLYDGLEVRLLQALASTLNFDYKIEEPLDGQKWGRALPNGSWTGVVGETQRGEADLSFANHFVLQDRMSVMDMTDPHHIDYLCFVTPKPKPLPRYYAVVWPFQWSVWICLALMILLLPVVVRVMFLGERSSWLHRLDNVTLLVWILMTTRSLAAQLLPSSSAGRVMFVALSVGALVLAVAYQSSLFAFLLVPAPPTPVDTLSQLVTSGMKWGVRGSGGWEMWFRDSLDPTAREIAAGFEYVLNIDKGIERVMGGDFAFMNSGTFLRYRVADKHIDKYGRPTLHITKECFLPFRIAMGVPRFSVYQGRFNQVIRRVIEAGMVARWLDELLDQTVQKQLRLARTQPRDDIDAQMEGEGVTAVLSLDHLQGPFYIFLIGCLLSLCVFLIELALHRKSDLSSSGDPAGHDSQILPMPSNSPL